MSILGKPELASPRVKKDLSSLPLPPPTVCGGGRMGAGECELDPTLISQAASLCSLDTKHSCSLEGINPATPHTAQILCPSSQTPGKSCTPYSHSAKAHQTIHVSIGYLRLDQSQQYLRALPFSELPMEP